MSSDESDQENDFNQTGYQWEPEYTEEELAEIERQNDIVAPPVNERGLDLTWCLCSNCVIMPTFKECNCCQEFEHFIDANYLSPTIKCITEHPDFDMICLNNVVLETAYVSFLRYKRYSGRAPDYLSPKQSRLMAYRQFVSWVRRGQPLGRKFRIVLPACIVKKIRQTYPEETGNYEGYHSASSSDSD